jgi:hypothetical protein
MLGTLALPLAQSIDVEDGQALVRHEVPGLDGGLLQRMGRRAARVALTGVATGATAGASIEALRELLRGGEPVDFVTDISTATRVARVMVEALDVRELAGRTERWEYAVLLREHVEPPAPVETEQREVDDAVEADGQAGAEAQAEQVARGTGVLVVQVTLAGGAADYTGVVVMVEGTSTAGERVSFALTEQQNGAFRRTGVPAGEYTVQVATG